VCWPFFVVSFHGLLYFISGGEYIQISLNVVVPNVPRCTGDCSEDQDIVSFDVMVSRYGVAAFHREFHILEV